MKRLTAAALILCALLGSPAAASPGYSTHTSQPRYEIGEVVEITITNSARSSITLGEVWTIVDRDDSSQDSQYYLSEEERTLEEGESLTWRWSQNQGCYGECRNVWEGEQVPPSRYEAAIDTSEGRAVARFSIGRYFTLGFEARPRLSFVIYVSRADDVAQLEAQAGLPPDEQPIVSGVVRGRRPYNPDWSFTMGPRSIVTGDVFIEVCDGSPGYVDRHRAEWLGERWCPWDGYVARAGR